jgi:hypothetical protein
MAFLVQRHQFREHGDQVPAGRLAVPVPGRGMAGEALPHPVADLGRYGDDQRFVVGEVMAYRSDVQLGLRRDLPESRGGDTAAHDQAQRGVDDMAAARLGIYSDRHRHSLENRFRFVSQL